MTVFHEKLKEVEASLFPIVILVLLLTLSIAPVQVAVLVRFLIGAVFLLIGLSIFLLGVDLCMPHIGEHISEEIATSHSFLKIIVLSFLVGFWISVAEPDLIILGDQISFVTGGAISGNVFVYLISSGVGVMVTFGVFRMMKGLALKHFMAFSYFLILILSFFTSEGFLAISFDSSGATTGALTTPFVLTLCAGLAKIKGGKGLEEDSFGLVGIMSVGPIFSVMLMSAFTGQSRISGEALPFSLELKILDPILKLLPKVFVESLFSLLPLSVLFFVLNFIKFKISKDELKDVLFGLLYTLLGLTVFLTGVNAGFMDMGRLIGISFATNFRPFLPILGLCMGLIVVLAEPAVHVLGKQIEEISGGHIPVRLIRLMLSIGVGAAVSLSMVRIMIPEVKLWYFLLLGFGLSVILSFWSDPLFVGIAYDAGGVASGPMTATFILAFAQGSAEMIETADVLIDGFGIIAMVAMSPVLCLIFLGVIIKIKKDRTGSTEEIIPKPEPTAALPSFSKVACLGFVCKKGQADALVGAARLVGARGATILHGTGFHGTEVLSFELPEEKETVFMVLEEELLDGVIKKLSENNLHSYFVMPAAAVGYSMPVDN